MPAKYRHMKPGEVEIWDRFIGRFGLPPGVIRYDLELGDGAPVDPAWPAWMGPMVKHLSRHRCDVVAETRDGVLIVEIKAVGGMAGLGQLLGYQALYYRQFGGEKEVRMMLVCEQVEADIEAALDFYGVSIVRV